MTVNYTTLLGLAQPVPGTDSGTWGDDINNGITALVDSAIAGTTTVSATTTLSTTAGAANQARQPIIVVSNTTASNINIIAPAQSKVYLVANDSGYTATLKSASTTGVGIAPGEYALVMWNSGLITPDFVKVSSTVPPGAVTSFHVDSSLGLSPTVPATGAITLSGTLTTTGGGTGVSASLTGIPYANGASPYTAATAAQIVAAIGSTPVANASTATAVSNLSAGTTGAIPYQTGVGATNFVSLGTSGFILSAGASAPQWINPNTLTVASAGSATSATTATSVAGGLANQIPVQVSPGLTSFIAAPTTASTYLQWNGTTFGWAATAASGVSDFKTTLSGLTPTATTSGSVTLAGTLGVASGGTGAATLTGVVYGNGTSAFTAATGSQIATAIGTTAVTNATNATNVLGGSTGSLVYQNAANATSTLGLGTTNYVLTAGSAAPQWVAQSTLTAGTATAVGGGLANQIPVQTGAGATGFIAAPTTASTFLQWNGTGFTWAAASGTAGVSSFQTTLSGLTPSTASTGAVTLAGTLNPSSGGTGVTSITGLVFGNGTSAMSAATGAQIASALGTTAVTNANNIKGGTTGAIAYQTNPDTTTFAALGTSGYVLTAGASAPTYVAPSSLSVGTATNVAGGSANQIHYQTGAGATSFIAAPTTASTYLSWNGTGFAWASASGGSGTVTSVSVNSANGFAGAVANPSTTPTIVLTTTVSGMIKGSGSALTAATDGTDYVSPTGAATLTNKRVNPRVNTQSSVSSLTPDISQYDQYNLTAQAASLTVNAPIGTPVDGNKLLIRILDNGSPQLISWGATYTVIGCTLPTVTTANKTTYVGCVYNASGSRWDVISVVTQV